MTFYEFINLNIGRLSKNLSGQVACRRLSEKSKAILIELLTARKRDGVKVGSLTPLALIFQRVGEAIEQNHIRRIFKRVLTNA